MKQRTAEIAGAGLAGLSLATRLAQLGWKVRLHEREPELRMFGAGIWLWENGLKAMEIIGAFDDATQRAKKINEWRICDHNDEVLMSRPTTPTDRLLLPPRADLYEALIKQARKFGVEILTSSVGIWASPEGTLTLDDGSVLSADLVVAADGAFSRIRESIQGTRWVDYGAQAGIRMLIERQPSMPDDVIIEYWNGPCRLLYNPCTDGQDYIFLSAPVSDERAGGFPVNRQFWSEKFPRQTHLIEQFAEASRWDRLINVSARRWTKGHVAVVGDAAHAMPPNLGQAGNMAFTNAMSLALAVHEADDIPTALAEWERRERPLTNQVQRWSYLYGFALGNWPTGLQHFRSQAIKAAASKNFFMDSLNRGSRHLPAGFSKAISGIWANS
jgi:2-polyprenyl-6-methoxyphenol hydroxylase-like FAD-dependent oxidoreductase